MPTPANNSHIFRRGFRGVSGFTIVELLVVIAIIVLLNGIIISNLTSARSKARDSKRVSDLGQIQLSLALYFDRCKQYPNTVPLVTTASNGCPLDGVGNQITLGTYISQIPTPPSAATYDYAVNGTYDDFVLHTTFEATSEAQKDSLTSGSSPSPSRPGWAGSVTCHDTTVSGDLNYCIGSK